MDAVGNILLEHLSFFAQLGEQLRNQLVVGSM